MAKDVPQNSNSFKIFTNSCIQSFVLPEICEEEVNSCIGNIQSGSAQGSHEIPPKFVKLSKCITSPLLTKLFNKCIKQETFPNSFKIAHVIPIPKVSSPKSFDDLRPISLLPAFAKIFETKMTKFLDKNKIITPSQFGFRTNSSIELAITTLYHKLLTNLNENKVTFSLFLDLNKTFDSVNHPILLKKLHDYGFRGPVLFNLLQSYLSNPDLGNIRPAGRIRPARPFYAARWHLQKCDLISRIKPNLFYSFIGYLRKSRLFALHCRSVFKGKGIVPCTSFDSKDPLLTLLFSKKNKVIDAK